MLIQQQQIIHLRQRWIEDKVGLNKTAETIPINASLSPQKLKGTPSPTNCNDNRDDIQSSDFVKPVLKTENHSTSQGDGFSSLDVQTEKANLSSPRSRSAMNSPKIMQSGYLASASTPLSSVTSPSHATTTAFMQREIVKIKVEGFLDARADVATLVCFEMSS